MEDCFEETIFIGSKKCLQVCNWWQMTVRPQSTIFKVATRRQGVCPKFVWAWWTWETQVVLGTANTRCNWANRGPTHLQGEPRTTARQVDSTHRNILLLCDFLAAETQESVLQPQSREENNASNCQSNHTESDSEEEEDLPGLLPRYWDTLTVSSSTTGQSECTKNEAMFESMGEGQGLTRPWWKFIKYLWTRKTARIRSWASTTVRIRTRSRTK